MLRLLSALVLAVAAFLGTGAIPATAEVKTLKLVVAFPPGGPSDIVARLVADPMSKALGISVIIENKPGGNTIVAAQMVANSPADGSVAYFSSMSSIVLNPLLYAPSALPYDPLKDFAPVSLIFQTPTILVVHPSNPANNANDFVVASKAAAQAIPVGSASAGGTTHLALELFAEATGAKLLHVPYKGAAPVISDLMNNQIGAFFGDLAGVIGHIKGGKLKALAVAAPEGHPLLPDIKTLDQQGIRAATSVNWYALLVPAKTPADVIKRYNTAVHTALADPALKEKLTALGAAGMPSTPEAVLEAMKEDTAKWGGIIKAKNIKIE
jgi:tripartite-type tricarboxylate transporter receptor subunit TctC